MFYRKPRTYKGLDHSEAGSKVLPPTFAGVKALVSKLGSEDAVLAAYPVHSLDGPEGEIFQSYKVFLKIREQGLAFHLVKILEIF